MRVIAQAAGFAKLRVRNRCTGTNNGLAALEVVVNMTSFQCAGSVSLPSIELKHITHAEVSAPTVEQSLFSLIVNWQCAA